MITGSWNGGTLRMTCQHPECDATLSLGPGIAPAGGTLGQLRVWSQTRGWQTWRPDGWRSCADYCPQHHRRVGDRVGA